MKFEIYLDTKKEFRWRLKASNGQIVADSAEGYTTKLSCEHGISLVKTSFNATTDDLTVPKTAASAMFANPYRR